MLKSSRRKYFKVPRGIPVQETLDITAITVHIPFFPFYSSGGTREASLENQFEVLTAATRLPKGSECRDGGARRSAREEERGTSGWREGEGAR